MKKSRRKKAKKYFIRRMFLLLSCLFFLFGLIFLANKFLAIEQIRLQGIERMDQRPVEGLLRPIKGKNYLFIGKNNLVTSLEALPYVKKASLSYNFPNNLLVKIEEEKPVGQIFTKKAYVLVNKDLKILEETQTFEESLPKITGIQIGRVQTGKNLLDSVKNKRKLDFFQALFSSKIVKEIKSIDIMEQGIYLYTKEDIKVIIRSYQDSSYKIHQLEKIYAELLKSEKEYSTILLDQSENPIAIEKSESKQSVEEFEKKDRSNNTIGKQKDENTVSN